MKRTIVFSILLSACLLAHSQITESKTYSKSSSRIRFTNFEFGFNLGLDFTEDAPLAGFGLYIEPKYVNKNLNEIGLLLSFNKMGNFFTDYEDQKEENVWRLFGTVKKVGADFFGFYLGGGAGITFAKKYEVDNFGEYESFVLRPGILIDLGLHAGIANLGFKFIGGSQSMIGVNLGFKF